MATINVKTDHGAAGDGTTDDTAALQNAIDAVTQGDTVNWPGGTYIVRLDEVQTGNALEVDSTTFPDNVTWDGDGHTQSVIKLDPNTPDSANNNPAMVEAQGADPIVGWLIQNLGFDMNGQNTVVDRGGTVRIEPDGANCDITIQDCEFKNGTSSNLSLRADGMVVERCTATGALGVPGGGHGFALSAGANIELRRCYSYNNPQGIGADSSGTQPPVTIVECVFEGNFRGSKIGGNGVDTTYRRCRFKNNNQVGFRSTSNEVNVVVTFEDCVFEDNDEEGVIFNQEHEYVIPAGTKVVATNNNTTGNGVGNVRVDHTATLTDGVGGAAARIESEGATGDGLEYGSSQLSTLDEYHHQDNDTELDNNGNLTINADTAGAATEPADVPIASEVGAGSGQSSFTDSASKTPVSVTPRTSTETGVTTNLVLDADDLDNAQSETNAVHEDVLHTDHGSTSELKQGLSFESPHSVGTLQLLNSFHEVAGSDTLYDHSGQGNDGTNNGADFGATGLYGTTAADFSGALNDDIDLPSFGALFDGSNPWALTTIFNIDDTANRRMLFHPRADYDLGLRVDAGGTLQAYWFDGTAHAAEYAINANQTYVATMVWNPGGNLELYVDGALRDTVAVGVPDAAADTNKWGSNQGTLVVYDGTIYYGVLDDAAWGLSDHQAVADALTEDAILWTPKKSPTEDLTGNVITESALNGGTVTIDVFEDVGGTGTGSFTDALGNSYDNMDQLTLSGGSGESNSLAGLDLSAANDYWCKITLSPTDIFSTPVLTVPIALEETTPGTGGVTDTASKTPVTVTPRTSSETTGGGGTGDVEVTTVTTLPANTTVAITVYEDVGADGSGANQDPEGRNYDNSESLTITGGTEVHDAASLQGGSGNDYWVGTDEDATSITDTTPATTFDDSTSILIDTGPTDETDTASKTPVTVTPRQSVEKASAAAQRTTVTVTPRTASEQQQARAQKTSVVVTPRTASEEAIYDQTENFSSTGAEQTWTVPDRVYQVEYEAYGAEGGQGDAGNGTPGKGAKVTGVLDVTPGEDLSLFVGEQPTTTTGGFPNGGNGVSASGRVSGAGGGETSIRQNGNTPSDRVAVAGGGGGAGGSDDHGGADGGDAGETGQDGTANGTFANEGHGATQSAGGDGGSGTTPGEDGDTDGLGEGGDGVSDFDTGASGGGGGGVHGGGAGGTTSGADPEDDTAGGGGGASSQGDTITAGENTGDGSLTLRYQQAPQDPSDAALTLDKPDEATLTWTDNSTSEDAFRVEIQVDGGAWQWAAQEPAGATSSTFSFDSNADTLAARVTAFNEGGDSSPATSSTLNSGIDDLSVTATGDTTVDLGWTDANDEASYAIYRAEASGSTTGDYTQVASGLSPGTTSYQLTGLENGEQYYVRVGVTWGGEEDLSNEANGTTTVPAPTVDPLDNSTPSELLATWTNNDNSTDGQLEVYLSQDGSLGTEQTGGLPVDETEYLLTGLLDGEQYHVTVRRQTDHANADSTQVSAVTDLADVTGLSTSLDASGIVASWDDVTDNGSYRVQARESAAGESYGDAFETTVGEGTTSVTVTGLTDDTEYDIRVRAETAHTTSAYQAVTNVSFMAAASNVRTTTVTETQVDLAWDDNSAIETSYKVRRAEKIGGSYGSYVELASLSADTTSYSDTTPQPGTDYRYVIRAENATQTNDSTPLDVTTTSLGLPQHRTNTDGWYAEIEYDDS